MVDISGQLQDQTVNVPTDYQSLGQQAFQSQVEPLREGFQKNLTGTLENLSKRGVMFGEVGSENVQNLLKEQGRLEGDVATRIGTSMGLTQLEQAFQSSENAKSRELQRELSLSGFEFQAGEAEKGREYGREMTQVEQEFQRETTEQGQQFASLESTKHRDFTRDLANLEIEAQRGNLQAQQEFQRGLQLLQNDFTSTQQQLERDAQAGNIRSQQEFASREARLDRDFNGDQAAAQRAFMAEENSIGRTFTAEEAGLQRQFQEVFAANREEFAASQDDLNRQEAKNQAAINLALSGNLDQSQIKSIIEDAFGPGTVLTTDDDADLQRVATAAGLSTDEYLNMRRAIGQGQLADILANPGDYIDSPQKTRDFQMSMAMLQINAQRQAAGLTPVKLDDEGEIVVPEGETMSPKEQYIWDLRNR